MKINMKFFGEQKIKTYLIFLMISALILIFFIHVLVSNLAWESVPNIRFGYFSSMSFIPLFVAEGKGFFADEGLNVTLVSFGNRPGDVIPVAIGGSLNSGNAGTNRLISAISQGAKLKIVSSSSTQAPGKASMFLIVHNNSGINEPKDLEHKRIGVLMGGPIEYMFDIVLERYNISRDNIEIINIGLDEGVPAFLSNHLDAIFIQTVSYAKIPKNNTKILLTSSDIIPYESVGVYFFTDDFINEHPELLAKFIKAYYRASEYANTHQEESIEILSKCTGQKAEVYKDVLWPYFPSEPTIPSREEINKLVSWMLKKGYLTEQMSYDEIIYFQSG